MILDRGVKVISLVERSTATRILRAPTHDGLDGEAGHGTRRHCMDAHQDLVKVRVAGSNPVVRSTKVQCRRPSWGA